MDGDMLLAVDIGNTHITLGVFSMIVLELFDNKNEKI